MDKEYGDNWQESDDLDGIVIYRTFGGLKNGRFAMGDGSIKKSEVLAAVKHNKTRPSGGSYQAMQRQNEELQLEVAELREHDEEREQMLHDQQEIISQQQVFLKQQQGLMTVRNVSKNHLKFLPHGDRNRCSPLDHIWIVITIGSNRVWNMNDADIPVFVDENTTDKA
ncbi:hypothetical protein ACP4OV_009120 [Aristida adscensionis]